MEENPDSRWLTFLFRRLLLLLSYSVVSFHASSCFDFSFILRFVDHRHESMLFCHLFVLPAEIFFLFNSFISSFFIKRQELFSTVSCFRLVLLHLLLFLVLFLLLFDVELDVEKSLISFWILSGQLPVN